MAVLAIDMGLSDVFSHEASHERQLLELSLDGVSL